ncbi:MAG: ParB N-terminal domain-containing protein, partial [Pseudomonadota bacterium]
MSKKTDPITFSVPQRSASERKGMKKLGKGLGALMGEVKREEPLVQSEATGGAPAEAATPPNSPLQNLSVAAIEPLPGNPRKRFDEDALEELAASIATRGVIQPIIV